MQFLMSDVAQFSQQPKDLPNGLPKSFLTADCRYHGVWCKQLKCNRQCKQLKPYIRCNLCNLCNLCLHGSTRRTAFGILVKSKDKQFSNDVLHQGLWKSKEISAPRHCFCYCSRCYPALNPMRGNLMATVLWQKATTFQYILIHFPGFVLSHGGKKKVIRWFYQFLPSSIKYVQYSQTLFIPLFNSIH